MAETCLPHLSLGLPLPCWPQCLGGLHMGLLSGRETLPPGPPLAHWSSAYQLEKGTLCMWSPCARAACREELGLKPPDPLPGPQVFTSNYPTSSPPCPSLSLAVVTGVPGGTEPGSELDTGLRAGRLANLCRV